MSYVVGPQIDLTDEQASMLDAWLREIKVRTHFLPAVAEVAWSVWAGRIRAMYKDGDDLFILELGRYPIREDMRFTLTVEHDSADSQCPCQDCRQAEAESLQVSREEERSMRS